MNNRLYMLPRSHGLGGPASFRARFSSSMAAYGVQEVSDPFQDNSDAILVIGGTRHLDVLYKARKRGIRIIQRLDGMNWIHRKRNTGVYHFIRSELNNLILATIRRFYADVIIYQSKFVQARWQSLFGEDKASVFQIYNGVNLDEFSPKGDTVTKEEHIRVVVVEGSLRAGHEVGLRNAIGFSEHLAAITPKPLELVIAAKVDQDTQSYWNENSQVPIKWLGIIPGESIAPLDRSADLFFSAEIHAPCPNSVIEAMACGTPIVAFATGSLPELVAGDAGRLTPYGSNLETLGPPEYSPLAEAAIAILNDAGHFRVSARRWCVDKFDINAITQQYLKAIFKHQPEL